MPRDLRLSDVASARRDENLDMRPLRVSGVVAAFGRKQFARIACDELPDPVKSPPAHKCMINMWRLEATDDGADNLKNYRLPNSDISSI